MNRILITTFAFILALALAACPSSPTEQQQLPTAGTAVAVGASVGAVTQARIGAAGGRIVSSDSMITLDVPADALSADTTISIEPLTNTAPGGIGRSYRLLPNGLTFTSPATLTINYTGHGIQASSLAIAYQDTARIWQGLVRASQPGATGQSVTTAITHFTDYAIYRRWFIDPDTVDVEVGASQQFHVYTTDLPLLDKEAELSPLPIPYFLAPAEVKQWSVENLVGGSADVGTIEPGDNRSTATYTAPLLMPSPNPVEVEAMIDRSKDGKPNIEVTASVTITGEGGLVKHRWKINWTQTVEIFCDSVGSDIAWTSEDHGVDTITVTIRYSYATDPVGTGTLTDVGVTHFRNCPTSDHNGLTITKLPVITNPMMTVICNYVPSKIWVTTSGSYRQAEGQEYWNTDKSHTFPQPAALGIGGISHTVEFAQPLSHGDSYDTTFVDQGIERRIHATLSLLN